MPRQIHDFAHQCPLYEDNATHTFASTFSVMLTLNDKDEDVVIRNGWTPEKREGNQVQQKTI